MVTFPGRQRATGRACGDPRISQLKPHARQAAVPRDRQFCPRRTQQKETRRATLGTACARLDFGQPGGRTPFAEEEPSFSHGT